MAPERDGVGLRRRSVDFSGLGASRSQPRYAPTSLERLKPPRIVDGAHDRRSAPSVTAAAAFHPILGPIF